ncbi:FtsW/RodA/SpoVE family cell cycle protein [Metabacillus endolithicus]|uniref:Probable peptidoglycan glycosyltransferase FtsW n=1 Tax=Metabacillus endolithicus TaxID=1535204 RepID=A0ABW5BWC9_9BACI|nr:FtsW/RodA/SpoVE family cell cycle protein [Metabacillus endolithicus]UPG63146.1 FtsW/RodA/SpoVE family cell cycle protein [Metabacillus endolithicus]
MMKKIIKSYDYSLILAVILLCSFGLVMVYSSSMITAVARYGFEPDHFFQRQKMALIGGGLAFIVMMIFPYRAFLNSKILKFIVFGSIGLLVSLFFIGHVAGNAQSWIKLGGFSLQPGEFVKLSVIIYLAAVYDKKQSYIDEFGRGVLPPLIFTGLICFFVVIQPDFGTAFIIGMIAICMIVCSGMAIKSMLKLISLFGLFCLLMLPYIILKGFFSDEQMSRFTGVLDPFGNEGGAGYQLVNSLYAIGSGGLTGLGLGQSVQKYGYLPESHTDFIMSIIAEELGILGVLFVLILLSFIVIKGFYIARKCQDPFGTLLAVGISSMIAIQSMINLGGLTGLLPITGVPLPFISYGGSSILLLLISMGLLINVSMFTTYRDTYKKPVIVDNQPLQEIKPVQTTKNTSIR